MLGQCGDGVGDAVWGERLGEGGVERADEVAFAEVDVAGVVDLVGEGVFLGVAAAVVCLAVGSLALHLAVTQGAVQAALE